MAGPYLGGRGSQGLDLFHRLEGTRQVGDLVFSQLSL